MDSLTLILKYIFNKNDLATDFESVESFFKNGVSFPIFITTIFKVVEIPDIKKTPVTKEDIKSNNDLALQFLFNNTNNIDKKFKNFKSTDDKMNLIAEILKKQYFKLDYQKIIDQCNIIVNPLKIQFSSEKDFLKKSNLIILLSALRNEQVPKISDDKKYINNLLVKSFEEAKVPLVLDSKSFSTRNKYQFYIQIEIIFDIFRDRIQKVTIQEKKKKKSSFLNFFKRKDESSNSLSYSSSDYSDNENEKENGDIQNLALLNTINFIGSKFDISFQNFEEAVTNDSIPKFVMKFLDLREIKNVQISNLNSDILTDEQIDNIKAVIEFLKNEKKIKKFKILFFDFEDYKNVESSTILFYENFLNCFFIKNLKQEMYLKVAKLLCTHTSKYKDNYDERLFTKYKIYPCLLHFLTKKNLHFDFNYHKKKFSDAEVKKYFQDANIPMIISKEMMKYSKRYVSFPIFYQLQFIFDALKQNETPAHRIVEYFVGFLFELKKFEVPKFNEIASSIKAKRISLNYQKQMRNKYCAETNEQIYVQNKVTVNLLKPKTFLEMNDENSLSEMKKIIQSKEVIEKTIGNELFNQIWNPPDKDLANDNGIIYNVNNYKKNQKESQSNWMNEISNIQQNIQKTEKSYKMQSNETYFNCQNIEEIETKLYKIFIYDESVDKYWGCKINEWKFNKDIFTQFANDKKINEKAFKIPLILLFDSYENDLATISSNFINGLYPNLDNENEIFVYALCDRPLSMLNFIVDLKNEEKASIKPIFFLLHIPKSKQNHPNLKIILLQIYSYLLIICDLNVVVLNKNHYLDQIEFIKTLLKINEIYNIPKTDDEIPFSFSMQQHSYTNDFNHLFKSGRDQKNYFRDPKFTFLINDETAAKFSSNEIDDKLKKNDFFNNILSQINKEFHCHFINVNDSNTYEHFLSSMNDTVSESFHTFEDIEKNIKENYYLTFSDIYLQALFKHDYTILEKPLHQSFYMRLLPMKEDEDENEEEEENVSDDEKKEEENDKSKEDENEEKEEKEKEEFYPDYFFDKAYFSCIHRRDYFATRKCIGVKKSLAHPECSNSKIRELICENLRKCSDSSLSFISQLLNQKLFWNYQQLNNIVDSHKKFLQKEFLSIINSLFHEDLYEKAIECHFDLVECQFFCDKNRILKIMKPFIDKIKIKNCTKYHDLVNSIKEGTNYSMKETENIKEIKVAVQTNKDLKSEIPQDF